MRLTPSQVRHVEQYLSLPITSSYAKVQRRIVVASSEVCLRDIRKSIMHGGMQSPDAIIQNTQHIRVMELKAFRCVNGGEKALKRSSKILGLALKGCRWTELIRLGTMSFINQMVLFNADGPIIRPKLGTKKIASTSNTLKPANES